ncbi:MAG TPA: hypothetical protein PK926_11360 [Spirochaetota bacterium]|nr:hypothetical protein [Spirochaetota bacterium]HPI88300.1 hypothetical protein [Spirochaetota bacterium]HPR47764.1 hypothetical protein [Spirochaetota bacterium]
MDYTRLIPSIETIPANAWLFWLLGILSFMIHIILVNSVLGGSLILLFSRLRQAGNDAGHGHSPLAGTIPVFIALAINFGVVPLLFIQVIYGHLYYTSSVLMAVFKISIIPLLIIAYYCSYIHKAKVSFRTVAVAALAALIIILLYIGFIFINNLNLMVHPEKWEHYFDSRGGTYIVLSEVILYARFLHFIFASIAVGGLTLALVSTFRERRGIPDAGAAVTQGMRIFAAGSTAQIAAGVWYLFSQQSVVITALLGGDVVFTMVFLAGICSALAAIIFSLKINIKFTVAFFLLTMLCMCFTRANVRLIETQSYFSLKEINVVPQYDLLALFIVFAGAAGAAIFYMLRKAASSNAGGGEA